MSAVPTFGTVVLDCPEPRRLGEFYGALLDWGQPTLEHDGHWADLSGPGGVMISFQQVENYRAPEWPGQQVPQQVHLDLRIADLAAGRARALALGAKLLDDGQEAFHVYADPDGHPFCLCAC